MAQQLFLGHIELQVNLHLARMFGAQTVKKNHCVLCCAAKNSIDPEYLYNLTVESIEKTSELERVKNTM